MDVQNKILNRRSRQYEGLLQHLNGVKDRLRTVHVGLRTARTERPGKAVNGYFCVPFLVVVQTSFTRFGDLKRGLLQ